MRRALVLLLGIVAFTWLQSVVFPGHSYLEGESQIYVPALERLESPAFLSRDLVATNPHLTYTIYDEATLFLRRALKGDLRNALLLQQVLFRAAGLLGIFLLAKATGLSDLLSLLLAALVSLGATLTGPEIQIVSPEPIPEAFASGLVLLALGLLARSRPLLAGLVGGLSLLYDPVIAAPFWFLVLLLLLFDSRLRVHLRPAIPMLLIALLLLANLAQLQPGLAESQHFWGRISPNWATLQRYRVPYTWISLWPGKPLWSYLALYVCGIWATVRIWDLLSPVMRSLSVGLPLLGVLSVPVSILLAEQLRWSGGPALEPARLLFFTVALSSLTCGLAGLRAVARGRVWESWLWFAFVFAMPLKAEVFELLDVRDGSVVMRLLLALSLAGLLTAILKSIYKSAWRPIALLLPIGAALAMAAVGNVGPFASTDRRDIVAVAQWAKESTWGNSMFVFPDAGREKYPGVFRSESLRPLWVDWESGDIVRYSEAAGSEWSQRWTQTMQAPYSTARLEQMITAPIDYVGLKRANRLAEVKPVFENQSFVIYDGTDLRNAAHPIR